MCATYGSRQSAVSMLLYIPVWEDRSWSRCVPEMWRFSVYIISSWVSHALYLSEVCRSVGSLQIITVTIAIESFLRSWTIQECRLKGEGCLMLSVCSLLISTDKHCHPQLHCCPQTCLNFYPHIPTTAVSCSSVDPEICCIHSPYLFFEHKLFDGSRLICLPVPTILCRSFATSIVLDKTLNSMKLSLNHLLSDSSALLEPAITLQSSWTYRQSC